MNKTCAEISRIMGVSKQAVNAFIIKNKIQPAGMKGKYKTYHVDKEPLASYLAKNKPPSEPSETPETPADTASEKTEAARSILKPLNNLLAGKMPPGSRPAEFLFAKAVKIAEKNDDPILFLKMAQLADKEDRDETVRLQMIKTEQAKEQIATERANKLKIENEIQTGFYLEKSVVKTLFGRVYAVHTSVLTPLPLKLSDMIDALPPSPDRRARIHRMIDNEIYAALETIQRLLIDYVKTEDDPLDKPA